MPPLTEKKLEKKPIKFSNLLLGAGLNLFEVTVSSSSPVGSAVHLPRSLRQLPGAALVRSRALARTPRSRRTTRTNKMLTPRQDPRPTSRGRQDYHGCEPWR